MRARFITVEGLDGAGKSTQLAFIEKTLVARGITVRSTREPGGTPLGETLRALILNAQAPVHPETETLLIFAARREHLEIVIRPALETGAWVLCDRFTDASFAYQAAGSGVAWEKVQDLERWVHEDLQPDLTLYFDVEPEVARARASAIKTPDRFEREAASFHTRVRAAYLRRAREHPQRMRIIDANRPLEEVQRELEVVIASLCN